MPQDARPSYQFRAWTVLFLSMLVILPIAAVIIPSSEGVEEKIEQSTSPPTRSWLDISIDDIDVLRPTQSNNLYPGQTVRIDVHLTHDSNPLPSDVRIHRTNGNQFTCVLVVDDGYNNVTTDYTLIQDMNINYTGEDEPGANARFPPLVVTFYWVIPLKPPEGAGDWSNFQFSVFSTITVDDDDKSDNFRGGAGIRISEPEFSPFIWEEGQEPRTYESPENHDVNVGDTVFIPFQLQNRGPAVDVIGIDVVTAPPGWNIDGFSPKTVYPNDFEELQLPVQISMNPFFAEADKEYRVSVKAYSILYAGPYIEPSEHTFKFKVKFMAKAELKPEFESVYLEPGKAHQVVFWLRNTGNGVDDYTLTAKIDEVHARKGWKVAFESGTRQPTVKPNQYFKVITRIQVPRDAPRFYNVNLILNIRSMKEDYSSTSEPCTLFADIRYAAKIEQFDDPFYVEPGKENHLMFNFTNEGNDKDKNQYLTVSYKPRGWWIYIDQTPLKQANGLGPRTTVPLNMIVYVEETTVASSKGNLPYIVIQARGGPHDYVLTEERYYFRIPLKHKVEISAPVKEKDAFVGGQVEFMINVKNQGNWLDTFNLSVNSEWAEFETDLSQEEIAPNETYPVKLTIEIPFDAAADTNPDTPRMDMNDRYDGYKIRISGYSQNETKEGDTLTFLDITVYVQPFYNFEMVMDPNEPELKFSMDHDQARAVRVRIANTGNIADTLRLDWVDNPYQEWLRLQNSYVDIPFDGTAYAILNINPRAFTILEEGNITVELKAISQMDPDRSNPLTLTLPVTIRFYRMMFDIHQPLLNGDFIEGVPTLKNDRQYSFQVNIENIGSEELNPNRFDRLFIALYDRGYLVDKANITYLKSLEVKEVVLAWRADVPGTHEFTIALEGDLPISEQGVRELQFNVFVEHPPKPQPPADPVPLWMIIFPLILIIVFAAAAFVFIAKFNQILISPIDTGYDETGEYRPWAVKEKLKGEPEQLGQPEEVPALPPSEKPALPPRPGSPPQPTPSPMASVRGGPIPQTRPAQPPRPMAQARPLQPPTPSRPMGAPAQARPPVPQQRPQTPPQQPPRPQAPPPQPRPAVAPQQAPRPQTPPPQPRPATPPQHPPPRPPVQSPPPAPVVKKPAIKPPEQQ